MNGVMGANIILVQDYEIWWLEDPNGNNRNNGQTSICDNRGSEHKLILFIIRNTSLVTWETSCQSLSNIIAKKIVDRKVKAYRIL